MTDIEMLPLPEWDSRKSGYMRADMADYARAVAEHNVRLRDGIDPLAVLIRAQEAEARAERLADALLELCNVIDGHEVHVAVEGKAAHARAALRDHDKEGKDG